jgi:nucleoid-associated protein YgaU
MGLFDFIKTAGKMIGIGDEEQQPVQQPSTSAEPQEPTVQSITRVLGNEIRDLGLHVENLDLALDNDVVTVKGKTKDQAEKEKIILALGNIKGIAQVNDMLDIEHSTAVPETESAGTMPAESVAGVQPVAESVFYTVQSGDSLSRIAKEHYDDPNKYMIIFEANKPMLTDPDKIYPGQVLRIPPLEG